MTVALVEEALPAVRQGAVEARSSSAAVRGTAPYRPSQRRTYPDLSDLTKKRQPKSTPTQVLPTEKPATAMHNLVVAEFVLCVVLIGTTPILMRTPDKKGHLYVPNDFVRLSAVSIVFFVLALMSNSPKSAKFAAAFGALITLGVLFNASGSITAVGNIFTNARQTKGGVQSADAGTAVFETATYTPLDLTVPPVGGASSSVSSPAPSTGTGTVLA